MPRFVVLKPGHVLDAALKERIAKEIRTKTSAPHVPNEVNEIPCTLTGKKMEVPVRMLLLGMARDKVASAYSMANPASLESFAALAATLNRPASSPVTLAVQAPNATGV